MNIIVICIISLVIAIICIGYDIYTRTFCRNCGCKMSRFYDPEEDAEVYQCPKCGRSYIIK